MNILAFDTCLQACSAAVLKDGNVEMCFGVRDDIGRGHAEVLISMIQNVLAQADLAFQDIHRLAVTLGPGAFTGVRVGIATARGISVGTGIETVGYSSLHVMAQVAYQKLGSETLGQYENILVLSDARRGEAYGQFFDQEATPIGEAFLSEVNLIGEKLQGSETLVVGSGGALISEESGIKVLMPDLLPDARALAELALSDVGRITEIKPLYLRAPDAKPQVGKHVLRANN